MTIAQRMRREYKFTFVRFLPSMLSSVIFDGRLCSHKEIYFKALGHDLKQKKPQTGVIKKPTYEIIIKNPWIQEKTGKKGRKERKNIGDKLKKLQDGIFIFNYIDDYININGTLSS